MASARASGLEAYWKLVSPAPSFGAARSDASPKASAVHIVHPNPVVRAQLFGIASQVPGRIIYSYDSARPFLDHWRERGRGIVMTSELVSDAAGFDIITAVAGSGQLQAILMVECDSFQIAVQAHRLGVFDIISKPFDPAQVEELITSALDAVARDAEIIELCASARQRMSVLTVRELSVAQLLANGDSNKTIARRLDISVRTVEIHRSNIMRRLGIQNLASLVRMMLIDDIVTHVRPVEQVIARA